MPELFPQRANLDGRIFQARFVASHSALVPHDQAKLAGEAIRRTRSARIQERVRSIARALLGEPELLTELTGKYERFDGIAAEEAGLVTESMDDIDFEDTVRIQVEERGSLSPDSLTGMEANLRFAGPETMKSKIFGRLSAWQNWIFIRPNAVGERGALSSYGKPESASFNWHRA